MNIALNMVGIVALAFFVTLLIPIFVGSLIHLAMELFGTLVTIKRSPTIPKPSK